MTMITINFDKSPDGLVPAIVQDAVSGTVLMLAYVNREALEQTVRTGHAHYWSRSRKKLWKKGETSGHVQLVQEVRIDCDADTILYLVEQRGGAACHEGYQSCFYRRLEGDDLHIIGERIFDPESVYQK
ncbi:phosphoribosyl-AMP cyclohydrolase [Desulfofustis limnaeus]|nr:phosphoribosyl-AMP cyclohydrolase [Desulfofustis sp.]